MAAQFTQAERLLSVAIASQPADFFLLESFVGVEPISQLFRFELDLLLPLGKPADFAPLLGQSVTVTVAMYEGGPRHFNGILARLSQGSEVRGPDGTATFTRFRAEIVPQFWLQNRRTQSRIFQQKSVPEILKAVLTGVNTSFKLGKYEPRDYCTQYRESDFAFASRLMEEEGIWYYFDHADGSHTMVVGDNPQNHLPIPGNANVAYFQSIQDHPGGHGIINWEKTQEIRSGKSALWDHSFELPGKNLEAIETIQDAVTVGTASHSLRAGQNSKLELYDFPGGYAQRFDGIDPGGADRPADLDKIFEDNKRTVKIRMQEVAAGGILIRGASNHPMLSAGHKFTLAGHPHGNGEYVVTRVRHRISQAGQFTSGRGESICDNEFEAIPGALPYRPPCITPEAVVRGTHTAVVVGPQGEEIFTDKYGRVKVQFFWDREGKKDANSSCWVRVGTLWAGQQWGAIHIPRVGQEVIVAFEEGDPDQPIIVGSVFNAEQMPPYTLPDNRTQSGIKSRSSLKADADYFNELRFEDKKGSEEIYFHAQMDFSRVVENNDTLKIGYSAKNKGNRIVEIFNDHGVTVGGGKTEAEKGNETYGIWNDQLLTIGQGKTDCNQGNQYVMIWNNHILNVGTGEAQCKDGSQIVTIYKDREVSIDSGHDQLELSKGDQITKINLGSSKMEAMQSIELKVGQNSIKIDQSGITLKGILVTIEGQATAELTSPMTKVTGSGMCKIAGGLVMIG